MQLSTIFAFLVSAQDQTTTVAASTTLAAEPAPAQAAAAEPAAMAAESTTMAAESTTMAAESTTMAAESTTQAAEGTTQATEEDKDETHEGDDAAADDAVNAVKGEPQDGELLNGAGEDMDMDANPKQVVLIRTDGGEKKALGASSSTSRDQFNERVRRHNELVRKFNQMQREQNKKLQKFNRQVRILNKTWICLKTVSVNRDAARGAADNCAKLHFKAVNKYINKLFAYRQGQKALKDFYKQIIRSRNELRFGPMSMKVKDADAKGADDAVKKAAMKADADKLNKELDALLKAVEKENAGYDAEEDEEEDADISFAPALLGSFLALL